MAGDLCGERFVKRNTDARCVMELQWEVIDNALEYPVMPGRSSPPEDKLRNSLPTRQ